jgi:hypothetical protein
MVVILLGDSRPIGLSSNYTGLFVFSPVPAKASQNEAGLSMKNAPAERVGSITSRT